jgi:nucleotide-binding universal stress UspA family protein
MYKRILVGVDGSETSQRGLDEAIRLAKASGGQLLLVHALNQLMTANFAAVARARQAEVRCESRLVDAGGSPAADVIVQEAKAWPADLIVLGTHGRKGLKRLALGSDAELVLRTSPVPLLLVRSQPEASK